MGYLLVTNDFPPKVGGIQSYLYELFRRLPPEELDGTHDRPQGAAAFRQRATLSYRALVIAGPAADSETRPGCQVLAQTSDSRLVLLDPALPGRPHRQIASNALRRRAPRCRGDCAGRLPVTRQLLRSVLSGASLAVAAGGYPGAEATRAAGPRTSADGGRFRPGSTTSASTRSARTRAARRRDIGSDCPPRAASS